MTIDTTSDRAQALDLTERIRRGLAECADHLGSAREAWDRVLAAVTEAATSGAWRALDYSSFPAYTEAEFKDAAAGMPLPERREFEGKLLDAGISTRSIAAVVGVDQSAVVRGDARRITPAPDNRQANGHITESTPDLVTARRGDGPAYRTPESAAARIERIRELAAQNYPSDKIAQEVGIGATLVRTKARAEGIEIPADRAVLHRRRPIPADDGFTNLLNALVRDATYLRDCDLYPLLSDERREEFHGLITSTRAALAAVSRKLSNPERS